MKLSASEEEQNDEVVAGQQHLPGSEISINTELPVKFRSDQNVDVILYPSGQNSYILTNREENET